MKNIGSYTKISKMELILSRLFDSYVNLLYTTGTKLGLGLLPAYYSNIYIFYYNYYVITSTFNKLIINNSINIK